MNTWGVGVGVTVGVRVGVRVRVGVEVRVGVDVGRQGDPSAPHPPVDGERPGAGGAQCSQPSPP